METNKKLTIYVSIKLSILAHFMQRLRQNEEQQADNTKRFFLNYR